MPSRRYIVKSSVEETIDMIKLSQSASTPVFEELRDFGDNKKLATLAYEKYYFRASNRAALFININNFHGESEVTVISTGSSDGLLFNIDWGAANSYLKTVQKALKPVLINEIDLESFPN
ncbi:hypothetical protein MFLO_13228 [Listeria floridensis FSL S10-1187]|uniref:Uncharacterized protein n=1 Tax=Listeria floridensis FSL S10-1187 TaxID=1265817 RepID=A0ABN0RCV1_9LIST|nr:DUF6054 family protein [Listeria floridensis]EUJ27427.1 hypothetical protein MFLO_13228 [Listeria floridensis FSL S10-1187]